MEMLVSFQAICSQIKKAEETLAQKVEEFSVEAQALAAKNGDGSATRSRLKQKLKKVVDQQWLSESDGLIT